MMAKKQKQLANSITYNERFVSADSLIQAGFEICYPIPYKVEYREQELKEKGVGK